MELLRTKNAIAYLEFPMVSTNDPESFISGETVADAAYYKDAGGAWTALPIAATVAEIGSTGMYHLTLSATEMGHDLIIIKLTSSGAQDQAIIIQTDTNPKIDSILASVENIGGGSGGAVNFAPIEDNTNGETGACPPNSGSPIDPSSAVYVGDVADGTYESVGPGTNNSHSINDVGNDIDIVYGFQVGGNRQAVNIFVNADVDGGQDQISIKVYDHVGAGWDTIGEVDDNDIFNIPIVAKHTGTGAELGKVYVRFETDATTPSNLEVFECLVSAVNLNQSLGYEGGAVHIDTINGSVGTEPYVNGTVDKPSKTYADAYIIANDLHLHRYSVLAGSEITLDNNHSYDAFIASGGQWTCHLGSQNITGAYFEGPMVDGAASATVKPTFDKASILAGADLPPCILNECGFAGTSGSPVTAASDGEFIIIIGKSLIPGSGTPYFDFSGTGGTTGINVRGWHGGSHWTLDDDCTISHEVYGGGGQTFVTGGANVEVRGTSRSQSFTLGGTGAQTIQTTGITGPVTISGTGVSAVVNLYGVSSSVTDTSSGSTVTNETVSAAVVNAINASLPHGVKKNTALNNFKFLLLNKTTKEPEAGLTTSEISAERAIDNGSFASCSNEAYISEVGSGVYRLDLTASDLNGDVIVFKFAHNDTDTRFIEIKTEPSA